VLFLLAAGAPVLARPCEVNAAYELVIAVFVVKWAASRAPEELAYFSN